MIGAAADVLKKYHNKGRSTFWKDLQRRKSYLLKSGLQIKKGNGMFPFCRNGAIISPLPKRNNVSNHNLPFSLIF
jgi:hypothetical protein